MFADIEALKTFEPPGQHRKTTKAPHEDKTPGKLKLTLIQVSTIHYVCFIVSRMRLLRNTQPAEMLGALCSDVNGGMDSGGFLGERNVPCQSVAAHGYINPVVKQQDFIYLSQGETLNVENKHNNIGDMFYLVTEKLFFYSSNKAIHICSRIRIHWERVFRPHCQLPNEHQQ